MINHQGWQADLIREKNCGYVLPAKLEDKDVVEFASYIQDEKLLAEQGKNAKKAAIENFSLEVAVKKYLNIFSAVSK
ncbi:MAG: hypothetical protein LUE10_01230 [Alistipes sp.]|nr:hypothetical protein [Alistipes sp.]